VQFDEKWGFVGKKEKRCRADDPADRRCGDNWDHVAFDPEHKLVVSLVPGKRTRAGPGLPPSHRGSSGALDDQ
jgi:hypothetical protein